MLNRKRIAAAVLAGIVSATSMTAIGCGRHAADANQSSEDIESSEETEEETETVVEEEIDLEKVKIDEEDLTETDPDESYEADEDSAVEREDGSVVVEATNEQGQKVVLVYENKEAFEKKENASIVSDAAVKEATTEVVVTVPKETTAGTKGNGSGSSTGATTASGNKQGSTGVGTSSGNKETSGSGSASGSTKPSNSGNSGSGSASKPTNGATQPSTSTPTAAPTQPATSAPTQAPTQAPTAVPTAAPTPAPTEAPTKSEFELMTEYFNATSEATIKQYFLAGFNAQRAAAGLGPVAEDATLTAQAQDIANRNAAAHYAGHNSDYGLFDYGLSSEYESSFPIAALEFPSNQPDPMSNGRFEGYAYHCGSEAGILHNPHFYTANTDCIGIGIARDTSQNTFYLVIEGRDYGYAD